MTEMRTSLKHRMICVRHRSLAHEFIRTVMQKPLVTTTDRERVEKSRWVWGQISGYDPHTINRPEPYIYALTPLGICHTLFGLTVYVDNWPKGRKRD